MTATKPRVTTHDTDIDDADFAHTGPGTLAGRYLRRFWHPIGIAADFPAGCAQPVRLMSEDFTFYRGESGRPHLVDFRCAHRGTQLSTGWVEGDCIRCFYHGWKYDGSGQCVEQPAEDAGFANKVRIKGHPCEEYLGLIFVYIGGGDAPPLPRLPEFETAGVLQNSGYVRACNYFQNLENGADEAHVPFVHRDSDFSVYGLNWDIPRISAEETDYGLVYRAARANGVVRVSHVLMPNLLRIRIPPVDPAETAWRDHVAWRVPIDDEHHMSPAVALVHLTGEAAERYREQQQARRAPVQPPADEVVAAILRGEHHVDEFKDRPDIVGIQDDVSQIGQGAIADRRRERLGRSDVAVYLLRKIWARELRALAEGRPLKQWAHSQPLPATTGV